MPDGFCKFFDAMMEEYARSISSTLQRISALRIKEKTASISISLLSNNLSFAAASLRPQRLFIILDQTSPYIKIHE